MKDESAKSKLGRARLLSVRVLITVAVPLANGCRPEPEPPPPPPDIVLITLDTLRADFLGCYGFFWDTSPNLDALARESIVFERCLVPLATTLPSHLSILTGVYPLEHGVLANVEHGGFQFKPAPGLRSFAEIATQGGYRTAAFVSAVPLNAATGIRRGFQVFSQPSEPERRAAETNQALFSWLARMDQQNDERPLFLWVHYFDPHYPYAPPPPYDRMYPEDEELEAFVAERHIPRQSLSYFGLWLGSRPTIRRYAGEIRYLDHHLAELLNRLRSRGRWDRTVVIVAGDHGQGMGQHHKTGHGYIYDEQLRAPLMIRVPGAAARRISTPVSSVDIFPTVLGLIDDFPGAAALLGAGARFLEQASGRNVLSDTYAHQPVFAQRSSRERPDLPYPTYTLTTAEWKFIHEVGGTDRLFRLTDDPFELGNVIEDHPETAAQLRRQLLERIAEQRQRGIAFQAGQPEQPELIDPQLLEQLRSLGYLD